MAPARLPINDLVAVFVAALVLRMLAALLVAPAPYTDAAYYTVVAQQLATGHGFSTPVLWSFLEVGGHLPAHPTLPLPSNGHWMPLTSIVAALPMIVLGTTQPWIGQLPMILISALLVPLAYWVAWEWWASRRAGMIAAILTALGGPLLVHYQLVDNFAVFGLAGGVAIAAATRAVRAPAPVPWIVVSGAFVGVATLARIDGVLLAAAPAVAWWQRRASVGGGVAAAAACLLVLAPWLARDLAVFGSPLPSAGGHTLWIRTYNEQFSIGHEVSLPTYLGIGPIQMGLDRLATWLQLLGRTLGLLGGVFAIFFFGGMWLFRRRPELRPFLVYWLLMFLVMGLVFTLHAPKGAFVHTASAWLPFASALAAGAVGPVASAAGRIWPFLRRPATHRFLGVVSLAAALILSLAASASQLLAWNHAAASLEPAADFLRAHAQRTDVVMYADPSRLYLLTGSGGVAAPFDPFSVVGQVVDAYAVRWVVVTLDQGESRDALGLWDGAAAVDSEGEHPAFLPAKPAFEASRVRVYRVQP